MASAIRDLDDPGYMRTCDEIERKYNICYGDITVYCGRDVREGTLAAYRKSLALLESGVFNKALVINSGSATRWALKLAREVDGQRIGADPDKHSVVLHTAVGGALSKQLTEIESMIDTYGYDIIMINSWEFTSRHPRYKDDLLFRLRELMDSRQITIVVYSHYVKVETKPGVYQRGTLGKLSVIAGKIVLLTVDEVVIKAKAHQAEQTHEDTKFYNEPIRELPAPERSMQYVGVHGALDISALHDEAVEVERDVFVEEESLELVE
jgi:hypothetical protein